MTGLQAILVCGVILGAAGAWSSLRALADSRTPGTGLVAFVAGGGALIAVHLRSDGGLGLTRILDAFAALGAQLVSLAP